MRNDLKFFLKLMAVSFILFIALVVYCGCNDTKQPDSTATDPNAFHVNDILYPDYACNDTLIVINADELNRVFDGVDLPVPATDSEIDSTLHQSCISYSDYKIAAKSLRENYPNADTAYIKYRIITAFRYASLNGEGIDAAIFNDEISGH